MGVFNFDINRLLARSIAMNIIVRQVNIKLRHLVELARLTETFLHWRPSAEIFTNYDEQTIQPSADVVYQ